MKLYGMLDSPYVRRVAVSLKLLDLPFEHVPLSVFRDYERFAAINPTVKAPTLTTDDGITLIDSTLILQHIEDVAGPGRSLRPTDPIARQKGLRLTGLALAACEKTVQIVYEHQLRPDDRRHQPWVERVDGQLRAAYALLEAEVDPDGWMGGERMLDPDIAVAITWRFTQFMMPERIVAADYPRLAALSARAEALPAFASTPLD
ncbi:glutathione S-transferase [Acuticoccus sediminis]|uniref:Glutathione S-transferase n=1 Tax=Acuticoccus sediminis TaxID=2184697 RepID=A0A8B2NPX4_9HYPH|nr:glutathione S-transferase [Acuticoccus sediminis]RAI00309.1 glutathione S-transferase [Acuticoccus sediminis]